MLYNSWPQEESSSCKLRRRTTGEFNNNLKRPAATMQASIDYETLDRLLDSITRDFSRKAISSRLETLARMSRDATTICDHILRSKPSTTSGLQLHRVKSRVSSDDQNI
jgi:hypothetical protein